MLDQDVTLVNNILGTSFTGTLVANGTETITPTQISNVQGALNNGVYTDDIATYLKSAAGIATTFAQNTVVFTTSTNSFKQYSVADIVNRINAAGISNVTAGSNASSQLTITKTTNTPATQFSMVISVGTENANVGFNTAQETIQSQGSTTITTPNLTQQQIVDQINNANITGISASTLGNLIRLQSNNSQLFIGSGSANNTIGFSTGITPAGSSTNVTSTTLSLTDILELSLIHI